MVILSALCGADTGEKREIAAASVLEYIVRRLRSLYEQNEQCIAAVALESDLAIKSGNRRDISTSEKERCKLVQRRNLLLVMEVTVERRRGRILKEIARMHFQGKGVEGETSSLVYGFLDNMFTCKEDNCRVLQKRWKEDLINHYGSNTASRVWCPIIKGYGHYGNRRATHLVPYRLGYATMGALFSVEDGDALMWSTGNGLVMQRDLEIAYGELDFCLLPIVKENEPDGWKIMLANEALQHKSPNNWKTWNDYDGLELEFLNDERPDRRFLFLHYFMCVYNAIENKMMGWKNLLAKVRDGLWDAPGFYLREPLLKNLACQISDIETFNLFKGHDIDAEPLQPPETKRAMKELRAIFIPDEMFTGPGIPAHDDEYAYDCNFCT